MSDSPTEPIVQVNVPDKVSFDTSNFIGGIVTTLLTIILSMVLFFTIRSGRSPLYIIAALGVILLFTNMVLHSIIATELPENPTKADNISKWSAIVLGGVIFSYVVGLIAYNVPAGSFDSVLRKTVPVKTPM